MITQSNRTGRIQRGTTIFVAAFALCWSVCSSAHAASKITAGSAETVGFPVFLRAALQSDLPKTAMTKSFYQVAAFPLLPKALSESDGLARQVAMLSLTRRIVRLLRDHAVPLAAAAVLERAAAYLEKLNPCDRIERAVCDMLSSLRNEVALKDSIKLQARAQINELLAELQQALDCASQRRVTTAQ